MSNVAVDAPLAAFYIIHDCVYQAPDLYTILSTRLVRTRTNAAIYGPRPHDDAVSAAGASRYL